MKNIGCNEGSPKQKIWHNRQVRIQINPIIELDQKYLKVCSGTAHKLSLSDRFMNGPKNQGLLLANNGVASKLPFAARLQVDGSRLSLEERG
jgi:hypothetical protein